MKERIITFNSKGHDDFIDFLKAYAIICVLLGHTFQSLDQIGYALWAGMQVPLFILVQAFHTFKKDYSRISLKKILQRVFFPFMIVEFCTFWIAILFTSHTGYELFNKFISEGGYGPGSYYPWLYIQTALLLPLFARVFTKINKYALLVVFIIICEGLEICCSLVDFSDAIYRLLIVRYLFLFFFGWLWVKEGIRINPITITISVMSLLSVIYFEYFSVGDEPLFFSTNWRYHRWPCYFYVALGLTSILNVLWNSIKHCSTIQIGVCLLAKSTYEVFLVQMMVIFLFHKNMLSFIGNTTIQNTIWIVIVWIVSITGGIFLQKFLYTMHSFKRTSSI